MHVFTPGASVVRFTEEETRSTFEPPPSRARKKNAVATASLFPPRERKKNTRRRPKEFKKSSNGFVVVRTRTKNDEQKSVPNNRCACARSARTLPPPLAVALIFETLYPSGGVFARCFKRVFKKWRFCERKQFFVFGVGFWRAKTLFLSKKEPKVEQFFYSGMMGSFPFLGLFYRLLNPNDFFFRKYLISPI